MSTALRQQRHRARERSGRVVLPVEVSLHDLSDALVMAGFVQPWDSDDRDRIQDGLQRMIDTWSAASRVTETQ
jgi:hypothetical protein